MQFSLEQRTANLSVGEFADFTLGPHDTGGGPHGIWRAQLGQHWHNELRARAEYAGSADGTPRTVAQFEVPVEGRLVHRGWTFTLAGRIDQLVAGTLREIKTVTRPLPADEAALRAGYPGYFLQLAAYAVLQRTAGTPPARAELVFVETTTGLSQSVALTPFDEALVYHQLDAIVEFFQLRLRATARRRSLTFHAAFSELRAGQENIQAELAAALGSTSLVFFEAPTGYGKTGCMLEFALGQLRNGRFGRLIWLTGKSTGQLQTIHTLQRMTAGAHLATWQVRNKGEHCVNHTFHCVRDACGFLKDCGERWPQSGLARFYLDEAQPHDLDTLRAAGREAHVCPYEITRAALAFNDVWIGDFNYVFAPDNRGLFFDQPGFDPRETLLVIDEAHNLPARVADAYSHTARVDDARALHAALGHEHAPAPLLLAIEEWARLLDTLAPTEMLEPAIEADVRGQTERLAEMVATQQLDYAMLGPHFSAQLWRFPAFAEFMAGTALKKLLWAPRAGELAFTCLDAAPVIGETLRGFGGAVLMSATLQPFANFSTACGVTDVAPVLAVTPWREGAYDVAVDVRVDTTFRQRAGHHATTARTVELMHAAAGRCLAIFFPSYAYAETVMRTLGGSGSALRAAVQPRLPDLAAQAAWVVESLKRTDALFLVLGSSFAESIDLLGGLVTHAMVVGPALPEVNAVQKARMAALAEAGRDEAFRRVYQVPGLQKVNQALGRLVRAPGQHAKVLLHCRRFADEGYASLLARDYRSGREITDDSDLRAWLRS